MNCIPQHDEADAPIQLTSQTRSQQFGKKVLAFSYFSSEEQTNRTDAPPVSRTEVSYSLRNHLLTHMTFQLLIWHDLVLLQLQQLKIETFDGHI